jgi:hypothetical protein
MTALVVFLGHDAALRGGSSRAARRFTDRQEMR